MSLTLPYAMCVIKPVTSLTLPCTNIKGHQTDPLISLQQLFLTHIMKNFPLEQSSLKADGLSFEMLFPVSAFRLKFKFQSDRRDGYASVSAGR